MSEKNILLLDKNKKNKTINMSWMLNFSDLLTLLITFFVLIYSISMSDEDKWHEIRDSFAKRFNANEAKKVEAEIERSIKFDVVSDKLFSLKYIKGLIQEKIKGFKELSGITLLLTEHKLLMLIPEDYLFAEGSRNFNLKSRSVIYVLATIFNSFANKVIIEANLTEDFSVDLYPTKLIQASKFAKEIKSNGYLYGLEVLPIFKNKKELDLSDQGYSNYIRISVLYEISEEARVN